MGPMGNDELSTSCGMIFHGYVKNAAFKGVELKIPTDPWIGSFFLGRTGAHMIYVYTQKAILNRNIPWKNHVEMFFSFASTPGHCHISTDNFHTINSTISWTHSSHVTAASRGLTDHTTAVHSFLETYLQRDGC